MKAYVAQVSMPSGIRYIGKGGKLQKVPLFFSTAHTLKHHLSKERYSYYDSLFNKSKHTDSTVVIVITNLETGMKDSHAEIMSVPSFYEYTKKVNPLNNKDAFYRIQMADGSIYGSYSWRNHALGKVFSNAGLVRRFMTESPAHYVGAKVLEHVMSVDRVQVEEVIYHDARSFYIMSPTCRRNKDVIARLGGNSRSI